ncbi:OTU domain-containing protein [Wolbachia endosymbiont of Mansonella perstans]|uniref:hypothetical protein n=1 Tax=Wolbachia endosymbiont of Mansonella perstans TaxID=229526 RepID=UPI001CE02AFC|nr:hypothetical protein [Wolbachia endosymbiont of Mansonella perstans]MCA4773725.1 hypothetical protein [Wolbachia endosymbiont of Mansonella perstans]
MALASSKPYPGNFHVGQAIDDGSRFFDSFRQRLEQQQGIKVNIKQLRKDCKEFAQNNPPKWFTDAITRSSETVDDYKVNIMHNDRWGNSGIEGRILCEKYNVKSYIVEDQSHFKFL